MPSSELVSANSSIAVADNLARLVGSPLGGLAVQVLGLGVVAIDAVTYLLSSLLIAGIRMPAASGRRGGRPVTRGRAATRSVLTAWMDGLRTIRRSRRQSIILSIGVLSQLAQGIFAVLFVVFVLERLGGNAAEVGLIRGVQAIGGVLGGVLVDRLARRLDDRAMIGWGFIVFGLISLTTWNLPALTTAIGFFLALFAVVGIPGVAVSTALLTSVQSSTPPTHLGRVFAAFEAGSAALAAVGVLAAGALADRFGVAPILDVQALLYVACGATALFALRRVRHEDADPAA